MNNQIKINYSVCNYVPSVVRSESIIFGIVIHCPSEKRSKFYRIKNMRRLRAFDDEYDPNFINMMSETFSYYFDFPQETLDLYEYDENRFDYISKDSFIPNITKYYVNEFKFSEVRKIYSDKISLQEDINDLIRTYLYYDKPKGKRISNDEIKRLLNKEFKNLKLKPYVSEGKVLDLVDKPVADFEYSDTIIKTMSFDYKRHTDLLNQIKIFHSDYIDNKSYFESKKIKVIIDNPIDESSTFFKEAEKKICDIAPNVEIQVMGDFTSELAFSGLQ